MAEENKNQTDISEVVESASTNIENVQEDVTETVEKVIENAEHNEQAVEGTVEQAKTDEAIVVQEIAQQQSSVLDKVKSVFKDKKKLGVLGAVLVIIIVAFVFINGPKSVINDIKLTFSGYDERGTVTYNEIEVKAKIAQIIAEKNGVKTPDMKNLDSSLNSLGDLMKNVLSGNAEYYKKLDVINKQYQSVVITLDKTTNLKNGDTVTVTIQTGADSPIKSETKTFTVEGLKPVTKIDLQTVLKENLVAATGYNGYGALKFDSDVYSIKEVALTNLKNGQKVVVQVKDSYINDLLKEGKVFEGNKSATIEVKGLKELNTIKNIADTYTQVSNLAKSKYANTNGSSYTYTIEKKNDFKKYTTSTSNKGLFSTVSVYKVNEKYSGFGGDTTQEYYVILGYTNLEIFDNSAILADLQYKTYSSSVKYTDADSAYAYLKSQGYIEYKR